MAENIERELGWDDQIENDNPEFTILPKGDYDFEIIEFERARHPGSEKLPPCNKAIVTVQCRGADGITTNIKHNLFLHTKTEGLLCQFFTAIGQRKKGEKITMNWNKVVGAKGRCKLGIRKWTSNKGEERTMNQIEKFYEYEPENKPAGFVPGKF